MTIARATAAALLFASFSASAQVTLTKGLVATVEQRVAASRPGPPQADSQSLAGILPRIDGLTALSWRTCCQSPNVTLRSVQIDRFGIVNPASERELTTAVSPGRAASIDLAMATWSVGKTLRISPIREDGTLAYPEGKELGTAATDGRSAVQCTDGRCLVTWEAFKGIGYIVDPNGNLVTRASIPNAATPIASDQTGFLLSQTEGTGRFLLHLDESGGIDFETELPEGAITVAADFDGAAYTIAYVDSLDDYPVVLRKVALDGTMGAPHEIFRAQPGDDYSGIAIGTNGDGHLIAISSGQASSVVIPGVTSQSNLFAVIVAGDLTLSRAGFALSNDPGAVNASPVVVANGGDFYIAWNHAPDPASAINRILGVRVDTLGRVSTPAALWSAGATAQLPATIASTGSQSVAVWTENDTASDRTLLRATRIAAGGTPIDAAPINLANASVVSRIDSAALGSDVLIAWLESANLHATPTELHAAIVHSDGALQLLPSGAMAAIETSVASDGTSWLVVGAAENGSGLRAIRIARSGLILTSPPIGLSTSAVRTAVVASNGSGFLVAASTSTDSLAIPLRADGTPAGAEKQLPAGTTPVLDLASNGRDYLLASGALALTTTLLRSDGTIAAGPFTAPVKFPIRVTAAPIGSGWFVSWKTADSSAAARASALGTIVETAFAIEFGPVTPRTATSLATLFQRTIDGTAATMYREVTEVEPPRPKRRVTAIK